MKRCTKCKQSKPLPDFYWQRTRKVWSSACKTCCRADYIQYRKANPEKRAINQRRYYLKHRKEEIARAAEWIKKNPKRAAISMKATQAVRTAVRRGILTRSDKCEQCGKVGKVQGSHHDYSKPLEVRWLCHQCHGREDHYNPKTLLGK